MQTQITEKKRDVSLKPRPGAANRPKRLSKNLQRTLTVSRPLPEVFQFCRNFDNLFNFAAELDNAAELDVEKIRRQAKAHPDPDGKRDVQVTNEIENELISWRCQNSDFDCAGSLRFKPAPAGRGTEMILTFAYNPPAGNLGDYDDIVDSFHHFKAYLETGEVPKSSWLKEKKQ